MAFLRDLLSDILGNRQLNTYNKCIELYKEAVAKKHNKSERDYFKLVLLTKPPFDFLHEAIIDEILDNKCFTIDELANYVVKFYKQDILWEMRERNLKKKAFKEVIEYNRNRFFREIWGD